MYAHWQNVYSNTEGDFIFYLNFKVLNQSQK